MEEFLAHYVGNQIKHRRKQKKLTQTELARLINKSASRISEYENGKTAPAQDALFALSRVFECSIDDLFPKQEESTVKLDDTLKFNLDNFTFGEVVMLKQIIEYAEVLDSKDRDKLFFEIHSIVEKFRE